ncbi:LacI family DNA-binding transcriptional regulator [Tessaracoccus sp.]
MTTKSERARPATQADVGKLAGVSTAVVSYALSGGPRPIAAETKQRVIDAAKLLNYRPNAAARALSRGSSDLLALVVPTVEQPYFAHLAAEVERAARKAGLSLIVANSLAPQVAPIVRMLVGQQLRGIILAAGATAEATGEFLRAGVPTVLINQAAPFKPLLTLGPDFHEGAVSAVNHLISTHGHRNIAYVGGDLASDERVVGWRNAMQAAGLTPDVAIEGDYSLAGGRAAVRTLLSEYPDVTATFFASDQFAIGGLAALHEAGMRVPEDFALVAFDGSTESEFTIPTLTTVNVPIEQMARDAVAQVLNQGATGDVRYPTELLIRRSCGCTP